MTDLVDRSGAPVDDVDADDAASGDDADRVAPAAPLTERIRRRLARVTVPQLLLTAAIVWYVWYFTQRSIDVHHAFGTASYDSALYDQGVWLLSQGEAPFVTLMGRNLFGDHTSFVLLFLVPLYWVFPAAGTLFFAQSAAIGAGAIPIFLYGRKRLGNEWYALVAAAVYLVHPALGWTNLENFHPDAFVGVFVGFAIYAALERKWRMYAVFVVLALSVKEDVSLVIVPLGVWVAARRSWKIGLATVVGSLAWMAFAMYVVMRGLIGVPTRNSWRIPFGGPRGVVDTAITNPTDLVDHLRSDGRPWYLVQMTAPFAWLFARLPSVALISAVVLFTNILSTFWYQYQIEYHYSLVAVPALAMGTVYALGAIAERREVRVPDSATDRDDGNAETDTETDVETGSDTDVVAEHRAAVGSTTSVSIPVRGLAVGLLGLTSLWTSSVWSPVPWNDDRGWEPPVPSAWADAGRDLMELVPGDAVVSAHYRITPHLAHRREIYQFPTPFRAVLYGPDGNVDGPRIPERAERVEYVFLPTNPDYPVDDWVLIRPAFDPVAANDDWELWVRNEDRPLPEPIE